MATRLDLKVGYRCNNNCRFCVVADRRRAPDRSTEELEAALERFSKTASEVVLTGGEPTVRADLVSLVRRARKLGYSRIQLQTNGRMVRYPDLARALVQAGLTEAVIALHGAVAATHDRLVRIEGAFEQVRAGLEHLVAAGAQVIVKTVVVRPNLAELTAIADLAAASGAAGYHMAFVHAEGNARRSFDEMVPPMRAAAEAIAPALGRAESHGLDAHVEAVPFCLLPGLEHLASELYLPTTTMDAPEGIDPDFDTTRVNEGKAKGPRCGACRFDPVCEGVWHEYPERFGWDEFVPVPGNPVRSPDELAAIHIRGTRSRA